MEEVGSHGGRIAKSSMKDVASRAGVGLSSVSRVLSKHPDVSDEMRDRVLAAVEELAYQPDLVASGLRRGITMTVGFLVTDIANPLFADIVKGAEARLQEAGYSLLLMNSGGDAHQDRLAIGLLGRRRVDGLILSVCDETSGEVADALASSNMPIVLLDREVHSVEHAHAVLSDHATGMEQAVEHLLDRGHQRVALLAGPTTIRPARERLRAFRAALARRSVPVPEDLIVVGGPLTSAFGREATLGLLGMEEDRRPTALVVGGNLVLTGALRALRERGVRVGRDLAVVSCDDVPLAELHDPPITTISRDTVEMGRRAADLLVRSIADGTGTERAVVVPTRLVERSSVQERRR